MVIASRPAEAMTCRSFADGPGVEAASAARVFPLSSNCENVLSYCFQANFLRKPLRTFPGNAL